MIYEVRLTPPARRHLDRLLESVRAAVLETLHGPLAENPHRLGRPLRLNLEGLHRATRGEFRIIYTIDDEARTVSIVRVAHRRDAYRSH